jgi:hypothetical protein
MSESAGGHSGGWLVTYCDMVTLLMACFIMVITFGNKEPDKFSPEHRSLVGGKGGSGPAGPEKRALDRAAVVWRLRSPLSRISEGGSEMPSLFADPSPELAADVIGRLDGPTHGTLADSYRMRIPSGLLFDGEGHPTPAALQLLHAVARNVQRLPYDLCFQVDDARTAPQAIGLCQHLAQKEGIHPGRLGVAIRSSAEPWNPSVWLVFVRQPW